MNMDEQDLNARFSDAFGHGETLRRQLRLTAEEADWARRHYSAVLTALGEGWYDMEFQGAYC